MTNQYMLAQQQVALQQLELYKSLQPTAAQQFSEMSGSQHSASEASQLVGGDTAKANALYNAVAAVDNGTYKSANNFGNAVVDALKGNPAVSGITPAALRGFAADLYNYNNQNANMAALYAGLLGNGTAQTINPADTVANSSSVIPGG
jgi:hypothetical protein